MQKRKEQKTFLIWDAYAAHSTAEVLDTAARHNITIQIVPPGTTSLCQTLDTHANRSFKVGFKWIFQLLSLTRLKTCFCAAFIQIVLFSMVWRAAVQRWSSAAYWTRIAVDCQILEESRPSLATKLLHRHRHCRPLVERRKRSYQAFPGENAILRFQT